MPLREIKYEVERDECESGVMALLIEQLQLKKLQSQIRIEFDMSMGTQPTSNSKSSTLNNLFAAGISSQRLQQQYDKELAVLNQ